jgi:hypothetical protein
MADEDTKELQLRRWDPRTIKRDRRMIFTGKPGTGKTVGAIDVMYYLQDMDDGIVMCPTEGYTGTWGAHVPPIAIYQQYDTKALKNLINRQKKLWNQEYRRRLKHEEYVDKSTVEIPPVFVVADDCMAEGALIRDKLITEIFMNGRHLKIFFLILVQWMMDMPINKRQLTDYLLVCSEDSPPALRRLYDNFFSGYIPTYEAFHEIMEQVTDNYGILVLDRTNQQSKRIEDHIFWWKATQHSKHPREAFRVGASEWWNYSQNEYQEDLNAPEPDTRPAKRTKYRVQRV